MTFEFGSFSYRIFSTLVFELYRFTLAPIVMISNDCMNTLNTLFDRFYLTFGK